MSLDTQLSEQHEGDEADRCGGCGSHNLMICSTVKGKFTHVVCLSCERVQDLRAQITGELFVEPAKKENDQ